MRAIILGILVTAFFLATEVGVAAPADPLIELATKASDAATWVRLGDCYAEAARLAEAKKAFQKALSLNPKNGAAELGLARIEIARGDFNAAKATCRKLETKYKDTSLGPICFGRFWISNNRSERAVEQFDKAVSLGDVARGQVGLGEAHALRADANKAVAAFRDALDAGAGYSADLGLGLAQEMLGDKAGALVSLERAVTREPGSCLAHLHYGRVLVSGQRAILELETALAIRPNWPVALMAAGEAFLQSGEAAQAEAAFRKAAAGNESQGAANYGLGRALEAQGQHEGAVKALGLTITAVPNHVGAYLLVADILHRTGKTGQAIEAMDQARSVAPNDASVYQRSGELYLRLGRHTSARAFLLQAVTIKKELSVAHAMLGEIACSRHLFDEGKSHYELALSGDLAGVDKVELSKKLAACKPSR